MGPLKKGISGRWLSYIVVAIISGLVLAFVVVVVVVVGAIIIAKGAAIF